MKNRLLVADAGDADVCLFIEPYGEDFWMRPVDAFRVVPVGDGTVQFSVVIATPRPEDSTSSENAADVALGAGSGVGSGGGAGQLAQHGAGRRQFGDPVLDVGEVSAEEFGDVSAGRVAAVADGQDVADLGEAEASRLGGADEADAGPGVVRVVAVAARCAGRVRQQSGLLVEAQGLGCGAGGSGEGSDVHTSTVGLDLPVQWKV